MHPKPRSTFRIVTPVVVLVSTRGRNPRAPLPTEENGPKSAPLGLVFVQLHEGAHVPLRLTNPRPRCCYCHSLSVVVVVVARTSRCLCVFPDRLVNRFQFAASSNKNNNNNTPKASRRCFETRLLHLSAFARRCLTREDGLIILFNSKDWRHKLSLLCYRCVISFIFFV